MLYLSCKKTLAAALSAPQFSQFVSPFFSPFGLTMQHGDDGERGAAAAGSGLSAASSSSSSSALSAAGAGEALRASELRAIPLEFLGRWLASEVGVVDEGTRLQDGVFPVTVTK